MPKMRPTGYVAILNKRPLLHVIGFEMQRAIISSTAADLREYRKTAKQVCEDFDIHSLMMEPLGARNADAITESLRLVDEADLFIGIYAHRYGHIPHGHEISICEMEYDQAVRRGIPRLIFVISDEALVKPEDIDVEDKREKLGQFKNNKLCEDRVVAFFVSPDDFAKKLITALSRQVSNARDSLPEIHNLNPGDPFFVGRDDEIAEIKELANASRNRIISILGSPGVGKTELAIHLGRSMLDMFGGRGRIIDLSQARTADGICAEVADAFQIRLAGDTRKNIAQIEQMFHSLEPAIVIFDNFEQAVEAASVTLGAWSRACEKMVFIVTSRLALHVAGELSYHLPPLDAPTKIDLSFEELRNNESLCVFEEHARRRDREFSLNPGNIVSVAKICEEVEYHPFSIVVVAQHIITHEPEEMLEELSLLKEKAWPPLEMTMRRLAPHVQAVLLQLSLFENGFDRSAVMEVVQLPEDCEDNDVMGIIVSLCDHCFLRSFRARTGKRRITFYHRSVKEFVASQFSKECRQGEGDLRERWALYYLRFVETWARKVNSGDSRQALDLLVQERENLLAVHQWALEQDRMDIAVPAIVLLSPVLRIRGPVGVAASRLSETAERLQELDQKVPAELWIELGHANWIASRWDEAYRNANQAVAVATESGENRTIGLARELKGLMLYYQDRWSEADEVLENARQIFVDVGDLRHAASTLRTIASCREHRGGFDDMMGLLEKSLELGHQSDSIIEIARALNTQGLCYWRFGQPDRALDAFVKAQEINQQLGDRTWVAGNITNAGAALTDLSEFDEAFERFDNAEQLHNSVGNLAWLSVNLCMRGRAHVYKGEYAVGLEILSKARKGASDVQYQESVALCDLVAGHALCKCGEHEKAIVSLLSALDYHLNNEHMYSVRCWVICVLLAQAYSQCDDQSGHETALERANQIYGVVSVQANTTSQIFAEYLEMYKHWVG